MNSAKTQGELLFETYLKANGLAFEFEKAVEGKSRRPDYTIRWEEQTYLFDVKDFVSPALIGGGGAFDPHVGIRERINEGRVKFKEYKEFCCSLVLHNLGNPFIDLETAHIVFGAMYGNAGFRIPFNAETGVFDSDRMQQAFLTGGKMVRPKSNEPRNTTISAIITLTNINPHFVLLRDMIGERPEREIADWTEELKNHIPDFDETKDYPRLIVWHNLPARIPFPCDLFNGPFDIHVRLVPVGEYEVRQEVSFRGKALPASISV